MKKIISKAILVSLLFTFVSTPFAHTTSLGYVVENATTGVVDIWYGTYHPNTNFTEGSLTLVGVNGNTYASNTVNFTLNQCGNCSTSGLPTGLVSGTNYFGLTNFTSSGALTAYNGSASATYNFGGSIGVVSYQGVQFTGLGAGTYQFTYNPIANPTQNWNPENSVILSSQFTLSSSGQITVPGVTSSTPDIISSYNGQSGYNALSALTNGTSSNFNNRFAGGTLVVDTLGTRQNPVINSSDFTIAAGANQAFIDQNGNYAVFAGRLSDDTSNGRLIIQNTGSTTAGAIALTNTNNNYSGGTQVQSGATLSIADPRVLGSGGLDLVGTATVPAVLETTASMTISNPITVTADPVFSVSPGTTTTVSSPITNGSSAGDVVVSGGGTLALTAANTYTGLTAVNAGSTLALVGAGSITPSSALNNSGTVDVRSANGNVALGGTFTQTSTGNLLMNISPTNNQQINVTGAAALAGGLSLNATAGTYAAGKYTLLTANGVTGTFGTFASNLSSYTRLGYALGYDANDVYLYLTPNVADTQQSLVNNASSLQNIYTLQNTVLANSFSYDCNVFGENDVCVSAGGRNTAVSAANGLNNTSALLIASYRLDENNSRVGAYADQNLSMNQAGNTVNLGNNTPLMGLFAAWNENLDGTGAEVKAGIAYGQKNASVTRQVVNTSEAGSGSSQLNSQGAQITAKYGFALDEQIIVSPYIGMRYTQNNMGGYTEGTSATVTAPLTYSALNTNATTALAGVGASYHFIPEASLFASAGVETDTNTANGTYSATGLAGLTPINFNANPVKTRPTAMLGASYDVEKNQRIGITGIYRQEAFQAVSTTSVMATYTVGF